jgi:DNA-binding NarL/FixJ family response regulator
MERACCLAGIEDGMVPVFGAIFLALGAPAIPLVADLDVAGLGRIAPELLVCDIDDANVDRLELLRQLRFVLPDCVIAAYTGVRQRSWARKCHLAGANCLLSKDSSTEQLSEGLSAAFSTGCYTDPLFSG